MQVLLGTCGSWYLRQTAKAFSQRNALAGLWISDKNSTGIPSEKYRRCWPYHLAMKPFYHCTPQIWNEKAFYALSRIWTRWVRSQLAKQDLKFDVVHAIMGYATEFFDVAEKVGALKVVDCANSHPTTLYGFWQRECDLWCPGENVPLPRWIFSRMNRELERADVILCPSLFVRDSMVLNGIPAEKCFVNPFGVDTTIFKKRSQIPAKPRFICVGTICVRKGHQYLFRAFQKVKAKLPEAELICVGEYKTDFRKERSKWKGTFRHYNEMPHAELAQLLQTATAFVFPSTEEGFARVISEAMGAGLPIVATHESGATTQVSSGVEGIIVPARRPQELAEAMIQVATDLDFNQRMGDAAYKKGAERNTWQDYGDRLLVEYQKRLSPKSANSSAS
jgi:glycosyltransferase involved in cell wall biosynthesis